MALCFALVLLRGVTPKVSWASPWEHLHGRVTQAGCILGRLQWLLFATGRSWTAYVDLKTRLEANQVGRPRRSSAPLSTVSLSILKTYCVWRSLGHDSVQSAVGQEWEFDNTNHQYKIGWLHVQNTTWGKLMKFRTTFQQDPICRLKLYLVINLISLVNEDSISGYRISPDNTSIRIKPQSDTIRRIFTLIFSILC